ncbi:MAG: phospholipid-binding protein [Notoacmeibacter sp.]|nr:phospholipid-binding protein [Notoacmeibacter sp.]
MNGIFPIALLAVITAGTVPASAMSLSFSWGSTKDCFDKNSPPMSLSGVPAGAKKLKFRMVDLDAPNYPHGGGTVNWPGGSSGNLPYGAFRYTGPCPPSPHTYQFTVDAFDGSGKKLATAKAKKRFP